MKLLLDSCVSGKTALSLTDIGHDVSWVGSWPEDPGDEEILATAYRESRILVTLDKDFGELAIVRHIPHSGIIRLVDLSVKLQFPVCLQVLEKYGTELTEGAIVTAEKTRFRIRPSSS